MFPNRASLEQRDEDIGRAALSVSNDGAGVCAKGDDDIVFCRVGGGT